MFPEFRDLITKLKTEDAHFARLFEKHNELDHKIKNIEDHIEIGTPSEVEMLKKEKLKLKDAMYAILKRAA
ncbi:YdcH family protein [Bisgaard Taxon 10/6]|uniref:YdcH family protein n=1 Tax=Exercitatus varius TaxID=67857 RepID=A0AAW6QF54_9PAST|nr:YdcH family protein [Exercitatus varius]QOF67745.1 YdcH family protein [Actinobacillus sp. GY-402]MDG2916160.1 YdcH family protein [Exercitatus varius]MDG2918443.1 YdcH family protein [Exercitatus varius]MDG2942371.1 YdcH family protein [Exercitatus varius]MDG2948742.1 YdcH family protein [Exercitatus varius]